MRARPESHWREYAAEAFGLGLFMMSAVAFGILLYHPSSSVAAAIVAPVVRNGLMGLAMGLTAIVNIYSPWGRRSGAHLNPAVTLTFFRLGKVARRDLTGYILAQFAGAIAGIGVATLVFSAWIADPSVNYVVTLPGRGGHAVAFGAELIISFGLMLTVLIVSGTARLARFTGLFAGALVALYIAVEAPLSGMSMNPARTVGSAVYAMTWTGWWLYFIAPLLGMLLAAELFRGSPMVREQVCAKLCHDLRVPCIFCGHKGMKSDE